MTHFPGGLQGASSNDRRYLLDQTRTYQAPPPEDRASFLRERWRETEREKITRSITRRSLGCCFVIVSMDRYATVERSNNFSR